jgi:acetyl esterase/lipase
MTLIPLKAKIMKTFIYLTICFLIYSTSLSAQQERQDAIPHPKGKFGEAVRLPIHFLRLALKKEKSYQFEKIAYGDHKRQYMLLYRPLDSLWKRDDIVVFLHGGAWRTGSPEQNRYMAAMLASYGYTVLMPAYRLSPKFCFEDLQADVDSALVHGLQMLGADAQNETKRLIIGGTSAGGQLAALLAYDNSRLATLGIKTDFIKGFFAIASPLDLDLMPKTVLLSKYAGSPETVTFQMANPKNLIDASDNFPSLFLHGTSDGLVDYKTTLSFVDALKLHCMNPQLCLLEEKTHLETTTRWYYKEKADIGQGEMLLVWLLGLDE